VQRRYPLVRTQQRARQHCPGCDAARGRCSRPRRGALPLSPDCERPGTRTSDERNRRPTEAPVGRTRRIRCIGTTSVRASSPSQGARAPLLSQRGRSGGAGTRPRGSELDDREEPNGPSTGTARFTRKEKRAVRASLPTHEEPARIGRRLRQMSVRGCTTCRIARKRSPTRRHP
jgi:hypothetical protein